MGVTQAELPRDAILRHTRIFTVTITYDTCTTAFNRKLGSCDRSLFRTPAHPTGQDTGPHPHLPWWKSRYPLPRVFTKRQKTVVHSAVIFFQPNCHWQGFPKKIRSHVISDQVTTSGQVALPPKAIVITSWLQFLGDQYTTFRMGSVAGVGAFQNVPSGHPCQSLFL